MTLQESGHYPKWGHGPIFEGWNVMETPGIPFSWKLKGSQSKFLASKFLGSEMRLVRLQVRCASKIGGSGVGHGFSEYIFRRRNQNTPKEEGHHPNKMVHSKQPAQPLHRHFSSWGRT